MTELTGLKVRHFRHHYELDAQIDKAVEAVQSHKDYAVSPEKIAWANKFIKELRAQFSKEELKELYAQRVAREKYHGTKRKFFRWSARMGIIQCFYSADQFARVAGIKRGITDLDKMQVYYGMTLSNQ